MAPKKRPKSKLGVTNAETKLPMILTKETLDDLRFIEPNRSRDRLISCLNELYTLTLQLHQQHQAPEH